MDEENLATPKSQPFNKILSIDIVNGLHCCDREFICVCLSLFEDSLLHRKLLKLYDSHFGETSEKLFTMFRWGKSDKAKLADSILKGKDEWFNSSFDDDTLRLILWIYLRESFSLNESISLSRRGIDKIADDLVAAIMLSTNKTSIIKKVKNYIKDDSLSSADNITFSELCYKTLNELIDSMHEKFKEDESSDEGHEYVNEVKKNLKSLDQKMQDQILKEIGADEFNDQAIRTILLTTGGFTAFSASVGLSGFSAYILAAQASAFIPFVTGPGLVSFVSVLSNPVTTVAAIAGSAWWVTKSANTSIKQNVASLVSTLLSIQSVSSSKTDYDAISSMFTKVNQLELYRDLMDDTVQRYIKLWANVKSSYKLNVPKMEHNLDDILSRPLDWNENQKGRLASLLFPDKDSSQNMANLSLLSIGDVIYNMLAINPAVVNALDFSRVDDISDALDFAGFAQSIMSMSPVSISGAVNNLKGYVAEQFVAIELITQGHQVSFPETSNQAGWDLLVDGEEFQVKCLSDISGLNEHFSKYDF
ncbi:MAG: hypothetical protein QM500_01155, partial [Methylococcales bacterium]